MTGASEQLQRLWEAERQCRIKNDLDAYEMEGTSCNRTWDNILCWPDTPAGQLVTQHCPSYIAKFDTRQPVTRYCTENGTWWVNPQTGSAWSNYSQCETPFKLRVPQIIEEHMPGIKLMYTIGYSLSLNTLVFALAIMIYFKRLHCKRNMIHINMFLAFGIRAALLLMKNMLLVNDLGFAIDVNQTGTNTTFIHEGSHWECKMFFTFISYIIFASLMWLLNEGLYLNLILSVSVFGDKTKVRWFVLLGWGFPVLFVVPWVVCRIYFDDMLCWNVHVKKRLFYIMHGPMVASVALNFCIFINIVRILYTKLTAKHCPDTKTVRYSLHRAAVVSWRNSGKLAKSTLILIPLFATYYMGFIWLPDNIGPRVELFKLYVEMLFNSFQGFLVALLFCFLNHEVQYEIRKKWQRRSWNYSPTRKFQSHGFLTHRSELQEVDDGRNTIAKTSKTMLTILDMQNNKKDPNLVAKSNTVDLPHDVFEVHSQASDEAEKPFLTGDADEQQIPLYLINENYTGSYSYPCQHFTEGDATNKSQCNGTVNDLKLESEKMSDEDRGDNQTNEPDCVDQNNTSAVSLGIHCATLIDKDGLDEAAETYPCEISENIMANCCATRQFPMK